MLAWGIERFAPGIAISTSFQIDSVVLIDMAYEIDPEHPGLQRRHRPAAGRDARARRAAARALPGPPARARHARAGRGRGDDRQARRRPLPHRSRPAPALLQHPQGAAADAATCTRLDAWVTGLRRDQWASRTNIRKVEIDHDHGAIVKLNPLAEWSEEEVWDYVREREVPYHVALRPRLHVDRLRALHARDRAPASRAAAGRWWWETNAPKECGIHCSVESGGLEHELHALIGERRVERERRGALSGEAAEVARAEAQAVLAMVQRRRPARPAGRPRRGARRRRGRRAQTPTRSPSCSSSGCRAAGSAALYGPEGEQATLALYRRLPPGRELAESAREPERGARRPSRAGRSNASR